MATIQSIDHIHLFGNPAENFYALGKRDKIAFKEVYEQISRLCVRNDFMAKVAKATAEFSTRFNKKSNSELEEHMKAYAEGLEREFEDVLFTLLMPEMVASFNKWAPDLLSLIPGCSSLFLWDKKKQGVIHGRILDYALSGPFEKFERSVSYDFSGKNKIFSYGSAGIALPGLTAMNEKGLTLALHYKHGQYFDLSGESIFMIATDILYQCDNVREAIKLIRTKNSISFWGLYLSDKNGTVASIDLCGKEFHQQIFDLKDYHSPIYFNNLALNQRPEFKDMQPFGSINQCQMRIDTMKKRIENTRLNNDSPLMEQSLDLLAGLHPHKRHSAEQWKMAPITPSSIQVCSFHSGENKAYYVPGIGPKFFTHNFIIHSDLFASLKSEIKTKKIKNQDYIKGHQLISEFQTYLDKNQISQAYHAIQMSKLYLKGHPEETIVQFYFTVMEYIYESDKRDMSFIYQDFLKLKGKLPTYLNDHLLLFLLRTSKLIGQNVENRVKEINHPALKALYRKEFNLNAIAIKGLKFLIFPRIEILDIIYAY